MRGTGDGSDVLGDSETGLTQPNVIETSRNVQSSSIGMNPKLGRLTWLHGLSRKYAVFFVLILIVAVFSALLPRTFFTEGNFDTILNSNAPMLILALGLILPLSAGEFDLSVAAMLGFSAMLVPFLTKNGLPLWTVFITILIVALLLGAINAYATVELHVNAFIATLATSTVLAGLTLLISGGQILNEVPRGLASFGSWKGLGFSSLLFVAIFLAFLIWVLLEHTTVGRYLAFVGEGPDIARLVGLDVKRYKWFAFMSSAVISAICGVLVAAQLGSADPSLGPPYLLPAYAAAFLGATTIKPGKFNAWGTVIGLYLLVTGTTGLELFGVSSWVGQVFDGGALILAVAFANLAGREGSMARKV